MASLPKVTFQKKQAAALLNDPFFWDPVDDSAPLGNDTGADVFERYRDWHKRNSKTKSSALTMLQRLFDEWGTPAEVRPAEAVAVLSLPRVQ